MFQNKQREARLVLKVRSYFIMFIIHVVKIIFSFLDKYFIIAFDKSKWSCRLNSDENRRPKNKKGFVGVKGVGVLHIKGYRGEGLCGSKW